MAKKSEKPTPNRKLTDLEKNSVDVLTQAGKSPSSIANQTKLPLESINAYLAKKGVGTTGPKAGKLMAGDKKKGVKIMTPAASMAGDDSREAFANLYEGKIHKIHPEE